MTPTSSTSSGEPPRRPQHWEKWVLYAYLRMLGATQNSAASAVGRKKRTCQEWQEDRALFAQAREEARQRWLNDVTDAARKTLLDTIRGGAGDLALKLLERVDRDLAPAMQRLKMDHEVHEGLSGLLQTLGGSNADPR